MLFKMRVLVEQEDVQTPMANPKIAMPVTMFLTKYGRRARFSEAPLR
jgi:hypothetical protein